MLGDGSTALLSSQTFIPICAGESLVYHLGLLAVEPHGCWISRPLKVCGCLHAVICLKQVSPEGCLRHSQGFSSWLRRTLLPSELRTSLVVRVGSGLQKTLRIRCWWVVSECGSVEAVRLEGSHLESWWLFLLESDLNSHLKVSLFG